MVTLPRGWKNGRETVLPISRLTTIQSEVNMDPPKTLWGSIDSVLAGRPVKKCDLLYEKCG